MIKTVEDIVKNMMVSIHHKLQTNDINFLLKKKVVIEMIENKSTIFDVLEVSAPEEIVSQTKFLYGTGNLVIQDSKRTAIRNFRVHNPNSTHADAVEYVKRIQEEVWYPEDDDNDKIEEVSLVSLKADISCYEPTQTRIGFKVDCKDEIIEVEIHIRDNTIDSQITTKEKSEKEGEESLTTGQRILKYVGDEFSRIDAVLIPSWEVSHTFGGPSGSESKNVYRSMRTVYSKNDECSTFQLWKVEDFGFGDMIENDAKTLSDMEINMITNQSKYAADRSEFGAFKDNNHSEKFVDLAKSVNPLPFSKWEDSDLLLLKMAL